MITEREALSSPTPQAEKEYVPYDERWTTIHGFDVKVKATCADFARKVHNHNLSRGFTSILEIGESGSGKTTVGQDIRHYLHLKHNYVMKFYEGHDILRIAEVVKTLPKYRDYILWFDDVSFLVKKGKIKEDDLLEMFHLLTKIRHVVRGRVICMFVVHYPYAVEKFLRQAGYRIITTISDDQREIYTKLYGPASKGIIEDFIRDDRYQTEENQFYLPNRNGEMIKFKPKEPFKIALASRMGDLTYLVYDRIECQICSEHKEKTFEVDTIVAKYNKEPKRFVRVTKWVGFVLGHVSLLSKNDRALYNWWMEYLQTRNIDISMLVDVLKDAKAAPADEREEFLIKRLQDLEAKMKEMGKAENVPEQALEQDANKEPDPEPELEESEDEDDDDNDIFDGVNFSMGDND